MTDFSEKLLHWHRHSNKRQMPWKGEKDPYKIWLSEVILQQTRVEQGWSYYEKFLQHFPAICDLANAQDSAVFKLWEGLGYYNRCKNLLFTARYICNDLNGMFPKKYEDVLALKGVGSYTASAICSFAYNQPYAVVDGNVFRVLSRIYGIKKAIDSTDGKQYFTMLAQENIDRKHAALYNQAIMDFGATVCKPANPACAACIMNDICVAYKNGIVNQLPVKEKILLKKTRYLSWFIITVKEEVFIHLRTGNDIWQNLNEFYCVETETRPDWNRISVADYINNQFSLKPLSIAVSKEFSQQLTHQKIKAVFVKTELKKKPDALSSYTWSPAGQLSQLAFPKIINEYLNNPVTGLF